MIMIKEISEKEMEKYFEYLVELRDSGVTNMFGARPYLMAAFDLDAKTASHVLTQWIKSFSRG